MTNQQIPLDVLFGDAEKSTYRISPNGKYITYIALGQTQETQCIPNIWIKSYDQEDDRQISFDTERPIRDYFWGFDSQTIFYLQDTHGDENWSLYSIDINQPQHVKNLTPFEDCCVRIIEYNKKNPTKMLIGLNKSNPELHDAYLLDLVSYNLELVEKNNGHTFDWQANQDLEIKGCINFFDDGTQKLMVKNNRGTWEEHITWKYNELPRSCSISSDDRFYILDYLNSSTNQLIEYDPVQKKRTVIAHDENFDIESVLEDQVTGKILAVCYDKVYKEWQTIDKEFEPIYNKLHSIKEGNLHIVSSSDDHKTWIAAIESDTAPLRYYMYEVDSDLVTDLGTPYPQLEHYQLCKKEPISFVSRDGLTIHGYLTKSKGKQPAPLIVLVHGGPWARDSWGYDPESQWLANRGYNIVQINFRGSTGFGKKFEEAGDREWGRKMHYDLLDGIEFLSKKGLVDSKKVAIYGGSYGGYAALVGAAFTPDVFCCAIDLVGPCNLITTLKSIPPYWKFFNNQFTRALGDIEKDEALLIERSPLFKAHHIKIPLLIGQGKHDPRVKQEESDQIVEALSQHNIPYTYKLYEDEGHGFAHAKNRYNFYQEMESFLKKHMPIS